MDIGDVIVSLEKNGTGYVLKDRFNRETLDQRGVWVLLGKEADFWDESGARYF